MGRRRASLSLVVLTTLLLLCSPLRSQVNTGRISGAITDQSGGAIAGATVAFLWFNAYPAEIENALVNCPGVRDCAVFGVPDEEFGESLVAAIEAEPGAKPMPTDIAAFLAARLARFKIPKRFVFHDTLPREASGKIFKRKLRDRYLQSSVVAGA